ncbi:ABC transporter permease [Aeromicrobium duanguangcaii]|uniref:FtsX-like permease family protein n=1 Tax=Aeromicrobium duanguangcaii TaxID=2968086 RepID=A0ABY5KGW7_9ACTN|nr:ABC transporter permease [Aeromicrobium duanguangcaii]MCD9155059.1 FtsX-like permease family protein [Aeromicrobium duanguangcaii]UUI68286.1 FtsX-like permease family protein [Aeromicrobium duanguangcaii]
MRTVLLASLRTYTRRYVAALLAVTIAVAFVVVIDALGSGARNAVAVTVEKAYPDAELIVSDGYWMAQDEDVARTLAVARERGDRASVLATTQGQVDGPSGSLGDDVRLGTVSTDSGLRSQQIAEGRAPRADDEALMTRSMATAHEIGLGDRITVGSGDLAQELTVVGFSGPSSPAGGDVDVPWPALQAATDAMAESVAYDVRSGDVAAAQQALSEAVESQVQSRDDYVAERIVAMNNGVDILAMLLLLFAAVAGFVAVLVIANTFTILFAQRSRDFALLRCVGATRRQVLRSVRVEAFVLALLAATIGVVAGIAGGTGLGALVRSFAGEENFGAVSFSPVWMGAAFVGGLLTTVVAAWFPTRSVLRVSPLAALRPAEQPTARTTSGRVRIALGLLVTAASTAGLVIAATVTSMELMLVAGMTSFVGILLLGPVLVPAMLRLVGRAGGRAGGPFRVAAANAVRNPRRSAATTASLLVGVTLATAVLTGMTSSRQVVDQDMNAEYPVDYALAGGGPIATETIERVRGLRGVDEVLPVAGTVVKTEMGRLPVIAPSDAARARTFDAGSTRAHDAEVIVPHALLSTFDEGVPERLTLRTQAGTVTVDARLEALGSGVAAIVSPAVLEQLTMEPTTQALWILADDKADGDQLGEALRTATRSTGLEVTNNLEDKQWVATQLDVLVWAVLGLLGVGVLIALVGIANTVGLSILERSREHALLRALGLTRRGLRRMLAAEGMLLALVAAVLGTGLGVLYAWFGMRTVVEPVMEGAQLVVPWAQLAAVLVVAALSGLLASTLPARRGARITPAEGLTLD